MGDKNFFWIPILFPNVLCTESYGDSYADSDTCRQPLMPKNDIFFRAQTLCRNDGRPPEWILSMKVFYSNILKTEGNPCFSDL
jgi:hypothetical protein